MKVSVYENKQGFCIILMCFLFVCYLSEPSLLSSKSTSKWSSIFPNENYDLLYGDWEKNIIFDPQVSCFTKIFYLNFNDLNIDFIFRTWK
jgi:hypothetical protein